MKKFIVIIILISAIVGFAVFLNSNGKEIIYSENTAKEKIKLPEPNTTGGMPLMDALKNRKSSRKFSNKELSEQMLSDLLWAAFGINRPETGMRTAPTANNTQAMDIYVIMKNGSYIYNAKENSLDLISEEDLREYAGTQDFVKVAPVNLIYVSDYSRFKEGSNKELYSGAHAGFIGQNVYLFCTSAGLNTVIRAWLDKEELKKKLKLKEEQHIVLGQTVGFPE
ncbi:MAG: SagB/ThcOx family dehydrogenase [Ignavibacteria bacterium]|nr:SagB/ThcOx family dehydrogenase [Ignavibacteria bacterium]